MLEMTDRCPLYLSRALVLLPEVQLALTHCKLPILRLFPSTSFQLLAQHFSCKWDW